MSAGRPACFIRREDCPIFRIGDLIRPIADAEAYGCMSHVGVRTCAMPVNLAWIDLNYIASPDAAPVAIEAFHAAFARRHQQYLPTPVAVPVGACPRAKQNRCPPDRSLSLAGHYSIPIHHAGE